MSRKLSKTLDFTNNKYKAYFFIATLISSILGSVVTIGLTIFNPTGLLHELSKVFSSLFVVSWIWLQYVIHWIKDGDSIEYQNQKEEVRLECLL